MSFDYVEIIKNGVANRGNIMKSPKKQHELDYFGKSVVDAYHSVYMYPEKIKIRGYDGLVYTEFLHWDIDSKDLNDSDKEMRKLYKRLTEWNKNAITVYFSGNKGFHVLYHCPELLKTPIEKLQETVKKTCLSLAQDLTCIDPAVYDKTRIIRTPNSSHSSTGLYKIPINIDDDLLEIVEKAKNQVKNVVNLAEEINPVCFQYIVNNDYNLQEAKKEKLKGHDLLKGVWEGFDEGTRNNSTASLAGLLHSKGLGDNLVRGLIHCVNSSSKSPLSTVEVDCTLNSILRYPVSNNVRVSENSDIVPIDKAGESWKEVVNSSGFWNFGQRFQHFNERLSTVIPGDVIAVVANSGNCKTTIGMELGNNSAVSLEGYSLFQSLEMSKAGVFFRAATIESEYITDSNYVPSKEVWRSLIEDEDKFNQVVDKWKNLLIVDKAGISLSNIKAYFVLAQKMTNNKICNIIIDYAQTLYKAEDITFAMAMARELKELAKDLNTVVFVLMQCNKTNPDNYTEVQKNHIEGAGAYFQSCDYILGMWKSPDWPDRLHVKFLKERWGDGECRFDLVRKGMKFHTEDYRMDLKDNNIM